MELTFCNLLTTFLKPLNSKEVKTKEKIEGIFYLSIWDHFL